MQSPTLEAVRRHGALLAGLAGCALLALVTTWTAALARVPQQRAAVERLLRAQTGLDVRYGRLVVRLGFYGPEAEFANVEMCRPGATAPLLRAPRMVARFESWRLLRGGQLRPGRVLVTGAEVDLRQLVEAGPTVAPPGQVRRGTARTVADAPPAPPAARASGYPLQDLEARLPRLLAGIPEGSLDFEAVTLLWRDAAQPGEPLQLRAPRLYASRRVDGAQLSGTLLLPARFGRTLFVAAQLRDAGAGHGGLQGRVRVSGRGLVLARWRIAGLLPDWVGGGVGDLALSAQLRDGRIQRADGEARLADFGLEAPPPLVARRFGIASADFAYDRPPGAHRYRLQQVQMTPLGDAPAAFGERGSLELRLDGDGDGGAVTLSAQRVPVELLAFLAARAATAPPLASMPLRVTGGDVESIEVRWPAARAATSPAPPTVRGRVSGLALGSAQGDWSLQGIGVAFTGVAGRLQLALDARAQPLRTPWFAGLPTPPRLALSGRMAVGATRDGWSAAVERLDLQFDDGPALRLSGAAGSVAPAASPAAARGAPPARPGDASALQLALAAPWPRARMAMLQEFLRPWVPALFWQRFTDGQLETASVEFLGGELQSARAELRAASFAAAEAMPASQGLDVELDWDGKRLEGRARGGQVGPLALASGRLGWSPVASGAGRASRVPPVMLEAELAGTIHDVLQLAGAASLPPSALADLDGRARVAARWRTPSADDAPSRARALELTVDVEQARWRPVPGAAPLEAMGGRLRADGRGLRDGRLDGRWLGGPVQLRLDGGGAGVAPRVSASGRIDRAALARQWAWVELVERSARDSIAWTADARLDADDAPAAARVAGAVRVAEAAPWRVRLALPGSARADLRWAPVDGAWRLDHGTVQFGAGGALAGIPGALVVGGRLERLDLGGLAGALGRATGAGGWQRPLVGEVEVDELALGATRFGAARLRLAGSRESTSVDLQGAMLRGELRQAQDSPGVLQASFARLQLPWDAPLASLPRATWPIRGRIELRVTDLRRGARSLGELVATLEADELAIRTADFALRRGAQRLGASGRCERATLACNVEFALADADLEALQRDLGTAPRLAGSAVAAVGKLGWSMVTDVPFAAGLQGHVELSATLAGADARAAAAAAAAGVGAAPDAVASASASATAEGGDADVHADADGAAWSLFAPLVAVTTRQAEQIAARGAAPLATGPPSPAGGGAVSTPAAAPAPANGAAAAAALAAAALPFESLDLRLDFLDGIARIERYDAVGRDARLSFAGRFDFRQGTLEQQADWFWIAPGVSGAVERLDPRSPLAAGLRTLRELLARAPQNAATRGAAGTERPARAERFELDGPLQQPRVERAPLPDATP